MKRHQLYFMIVGLLAVAPICFAQTNKRARTPTDNSRFKKSKIITNKVVGTWKLISDEFRRPNGEVIPYPGLGPNVRGLLVYDATGHMAVHIVNMDRPGFDGVRSAACDDLRTALRGYRGYFGTYEVNEKESYVIHHVEGSVFPNLPGQHLKRSFKVSGNRLILQAEESANGEEGTALVTWERLK